MTIVDLINFTIFSLLEYGALFFLMFTLFRLKMLDYIPKIILTSNILLYVSISLREGFELELLAPISQMFLLCILMWQLFSLNFLHAVIMSVVGYVCYAIIQTILYLIYTPDIALFSNEVYILQIITAFITFIITLILKKFNIGYSFIVKKPNKVKLSKLKFSLAFLILGFLPLISMYYFLYKPDFKVVYVLFFIVYLSIVISLIIKKWKQNLKQQVFNKTMKAMDSGTSIINHTIKNEINKINFLINQLNEELRGKYNDEKMNETVHQIMSSSNHMNEMTVRIKEKMEDVDLIISDIHLNDLIREVLDSLQQIINNRKIQVNVNTDNDILIQGDQTHIREALINIINNSIEELKNCSYPQIDIGIREEKKYIRLYVKDNGNGISKEIQDKVLDPFFTTKKTGSNYGLGLTYGYNIMKKHNGDLKIISEEQQGTEVVLSFPIINLIIQEIIK
ncbi:sensor histidine kinase [Chengkuizengella marina]|uniref:histidine kinase n=1 Tax=Chengkuizengella marina TaxID=2507566 RepID=A0A6N9Q100_9BACL|nr:HAMP domain-containing sensor histidine kinase [Chengkuizengella marina]NBI28886.1 HAMP domain-containing histidine kinase [Chengkuizengella marina]